MHNLFKNIETIEKNKTTKTQLFYTITQLNIDSFTVNYCVTCWFQNC